MQYVPVCEEAEAFAVSKDVLAIGSLDYVRLIPPSYTVHRVKVSETNDFGDAYVRSAVFNNVETFVDCL